MLFVIIIILLLMSSGFGISPFFYRPRMFHHYRGFGPEFYHRPPMGGPHGPGMRGHGGFRGGPRF